MTFDCTRHATQGGGKATEAEQSDALAANKMVKLGGKVSAQAKGIEADSDTMDVARALYDHTLERMRYDKPAGGDWGRGDSEWACDSRFGNCTDFHSYFMALARTKGIPARFEMGFPIPAGDEQVAKVGGYHCWAYFYDKAKGWVPVDISEADKHAEMAEFFFGNLDENRVTMTGGRDLLLTPRPAAGALNFFVYPYLEIDGKDASKTNIQKAFERTNK
jgi:transglutaminase-like putative cysteine protease